MIYFSQKNVVRSPKLSINESVQYLDGWLLKNTSTLKPVC